MRNQEWWSILVCPDTRTSLAPADGELVARLNRAMAAGEVSNRAGQPVRGPIQGGLIRQDKLVLYPIVDGIPVMLIDEAIPLEQLSGGGQGPIGQ